MGFKVVTGCELEFYTIRKNITEIIETGKIDLPIADTYVSFIFLFKYKKLNIKDLLFLLIILL